MKTRRLQLAGSALLLLAVCLVSGRAQSPLAGPNAWTDDWRRTSRGWERASHWQLREPAPALGAVHPLVVASFQLLVSVGALLTFEARPPARGSSTA